MSPWENNNHVFLCPNFPKGNLKLSTRGDQINLKEYAKAAQLNIVIVLRSIPALTNQTDKVEKTNRIGKPDENPKKNIFKHLLFKKIDKSFFN